MMTRFLVSLAVLAACDVPASTDGQSSALLVQNDGNSPVIGFFFAPSGAGGAVPDLMPGIGNIAPGALRRFNIDTGNGLCIFDLKATFASGVSTEMKNADVCGAIAGGQAWIVGDTT
jgi:hypothetical protein